MHGEVIHKEAQLCLRQLSTQLVAWVKEHQVEGIRGERSSSQDGTEGAGLL